MAMATAVPVLVSYEYMEQMQTQCFVSPPYWSYGVPTFGVAQNGTTYVLQPVPQANQAMVSANWAGNANTMSMRLEDQCQHTMQAPAPGTWNQEFPDESPARSSRRSHRKRGSGKGRISIASPPASPESTRFPSSEYLSDHQDGSSLESSTEDTGEEKVDKGMLAFCKELTIKLKSCEEKQFQEAAASLKGKVATLSFQKAGCRVIQLALTALSQADAEAIAMELQGHVLAATADPNANHVLQKIVERLTGDKKSFIARELLGSVEKVARHRYGCRVIQRLVEHCGTCPDSWAVINKIMTDIKDLSRTVYGHHVVNHLLENANYQVQKDQIGAVLYENLEILIQSRHAREVMVKALEFPVNDNYKNGIACQVFRDPLRVMGLAQSKNGHTLIAAAMLVNVGPTWVQHTQSQLSRIKNGLEVSTNAGGKNGKHVLKMLEDININ